MMMSRLRLATVLLIVGISWVASSPRGVDGSTAVPVETTLVAPDDEEGESPYIIVSQPSVL